MYEKIQYNVVDPHIRAFLFIWSIKSFILMIVCIFLGNIFHTIFFIGTFIEFFEFIICLIMSFEVMADINIRQLLEGETRKMRKRHKKILKLKAKQNELACKAEQEKQIQILNCKIHELQLEIKNNIIKCKSCGNKVYKKACYCNKCGQKLR